MSAGSSITLHGGTRGASADLPPCPAILFKLSDELLQDVREVSSGSGALQFIGGKVPRIRLGKRTIDLTISDEAFRHELYTASLDSVHDLELTGLIGHRAELKAPERKQSIGSDAALASLQSSLASYQREKQANQTNITTSVLPAPRNRFDAARKQKLDAKRGLLSSRNELGASDSRQARRGAAAPTSADEFAARQQAMRTPILHLLAMKPMSREEIAAQTHIPKESLDDLLQRVGKQADGKWQLTERAFKELDVWKFGYPSAEDRQAAINNAIRAYDRLRLGKDEKLWQMLLPEKERGKGTVLSKLQLGTAAATGAGSGAAGALLSPNANAESGVAETKAASTTNTPRLGPSSTPKMGTSKADGNVALSKRLFSKDPKKARAADDAKERKRKERETAGASTTTTTAAGAASSERDQNRPARKRQTTKNNNPKIKSAEIVHSSDDDSGEEGEVKENSRAAAAAAAAAPAKNNIGSSNSSSSSSQANKPAAGERKAGSLNARSTTKVAANKSPDSSDVPIKSKVSASKAAPATARTLPPASSLRASNRPALSKSITNGAASANPLPHKTQLSPQKLGNNNKPKVPSPLGPLRQRVASDVSDRGAVGVQRVRQGAETPKGLGITNGGVRKRQDTVTSSTESITSSNSDKTKRDARSATDKAAAAATTTPTTTTSTTTTNGTKHAVGSKMMATLVNGSGPKGDGSLKRKTHEAAREDAPPPVAKHRRTESTASQASKLHVRSSPANGNTNASAAAAAAAAADSIFSTGGGGGGGAPHGADSSATILTNISYSQGVSLAQRFRDEFYPTYAKMYDEQAEKEARGEKVPREEREQLWKMHRRLEEIKLQLKAASHREHLED